MKTTRALFLTLLAFAAVTGCDKITGKKPVPDDTPPTPATLSSAPESVPPAASFNATPVAAFADAGNIEGKSPLEQAQYYEANGQLWMARLVLETRALGSDATKQETEQLLKICMSQGDGPCVEKCGTKLGRKIKFDGGAAPATFGSSVPAGVGAEHEEPDTELAKARNMVLKNNLDGARKILQPKVLAGSAAKEEIRLLQTVCQKQKDAMCIALCEQKLKEAK